MAEIPKPYDGMIWPVEARTIEEAKAIWARQGFTTVRTMTREELERQFPGYTERRAKLKGKG